MNTRADFKGVVLACPVTIPYSTGTDIGAMALTAAALRQLLADADLEKPALEGLAISSFSLAPDTPVSITEHFELKLRWLESLPFGGASGVIAIKRAARAVLNGDAEVVACIGADNAGPAQFKKLVDNFSQFTSDATQPYGAAGPNAIFALHTAKYMQDFGASREDFGRLCVAFRDNALSNKYALMQQALSIQEYLDARPIADPLHLFDCVRPCAGAEAFLVMTEERARKQQLPYVELCAVEELHDGSQPPGIPVHGGWADFSNKLYKDATCGPEDIDILQVYDDYPVIAFHQIEDLGFAKKGAAAAFIRDNDIRWNTPGLSINSGGGQLSGGQAGFAGGFLGITETLRQLTNSANDHQIENASLAVVSGFGMVNYDHGLCSSAAILRANK